MDIDILDRVISVGPDDILLFQANRMITRDEAQMLRDLITAAIGDRIPFLVMGSDFTATVVRKAEA